MDRTLEALNYSHSENADLATRFSLFFTPDFKRLDRQLLDVIPPVNNRYIEVLNHYKTTNKLGVAEWNDKSYGKIGDRIADQLQKKGIDIDTLLKGKGDDTGFDSLVWINKRTKDLLNFTYGTDSSVFKPAITSTGDSPLLLGKTVFVYEPAMEGIFSKDPSLDMLITRSSDKLESMRKPIEKSVDDLVNIDSQTLANHVEYMPLEALSIKMIPKKKASASHSYSLFQYANSKDVSETYDTHYKKQLGDDLENLAEIMDNPILKKLAVMELKKVGRDFTLEDLHEAGPAAEHMGNMLEWMSIAREADPSVFGDNMAVNILKSKFIDPHINRKSKFSNTETGGSSVIKQSLFKRDLDVTIVKDGKVEQYGELYLPNHVREEAFIHSDPKVKTKLINKKNNSIHDVDKAFIKEVTAKWKAEGRSDKEAAELAKGEWKALSDLNEMGALYDTMKDLNEDFQIADAVARYPRTKPNDFMLVRLRDFLETDEGNTAILNDLDVYKVIEGDYDVDKIDYFWSHNNSTFNFIRNSHKTWTESPNQEAFEPSLPKLELLSDSPNASGDWNNFDANTRVSKRGIGVVQKLIDGMNHLKDIGRLEEDGGRTLLEYPDANGSKIQVRIHWDNTEALQRFVMEGQLMIDFKKGVSSKILHRMADWKGDYLFPNKENSYSATHFDSDSRAMGFIKERSEAGDAQGKRIRPFVRYVNGVEQDVLTKMDERIILSLLQKHGKFMSLATNVYDRGTPKKAGYDNIMSYSDEYFNHLSDISSSTYRTIQREFNTGGTKKDFEAMWSPEQRIRAASKWKIDKNIDIGMKDTYNWLTRSPFVPSVVKSAGEIKDGRRGSIFTRTMNQIWDRDPLNKRDYETILTGDLYKELEYANRLILGESEIDINKIGNLIPKILKDFNKARASIIYLKRTAAQLANQSNIPEKLRTARLDGLNKAIKDYEQELLPFMSKKYWQSRKSKDLPKIDLVDMTTDREAQRGTTQLWTMNYLVDKFRTSRTKQFRDDLSDARQTISAYWGDYFGKNLMPFGTKTISTAEHSDKLRKPFKDGADVQTKIQEVINDNVQKHKVGWLFEFMMPYQNRTSLGMYQGKIMPLATKENTSFKQGIIYLLNQRRQAKTNREKKQITDILSIIAKRWAAYNNFFSGQARLIPYDDTQLFHHLNEIPDIPEAFTKYSQKYDAIQFKKDKFYDDVFGMGANYGNTMMFYRELYNSVKRGKEFGDLEAKMSDLHQLAVENRYMNPYSYISMMSNMREDLKSLGADKVLKKGISRDGSQSNMWEMPLVGAFEGTGADTGFSMDPMTFLNSYKGRMMSRYLKQSRDMVEAKPVNKWKQAQDEYKAGKCKGTI